MECGEAEPLRERHRDHFLFFSEEAEAQLTGPEQARWYERLEAEHENLRAAISWSEQAPEGAEAGLRWWGRCGSSGRCAATSPRATPTPWPCSAGRARSFAPPPGPRRWAPWPRSRRLGDFEAVVRAVGESLAIYQELGDKAGQAAVLMGMGFTQRDGEAARAFFERAWRCGAS
jgi:hypothetical protein